MTLSKTELLKKSSGSEEIDAPKEWLLCWSRFSEKKSCSEKVAKYARREIAIWKKILS